MNYTQKHLAASLNEAWCITTTDVFSDVSYLGWQNLPWDDGYFWTHEDVIPEIIQSNTQDHPFLFNSRSAAIAYLKTLGLSQRCKVVKWSQRTKT